MTNVLLYWNHICVLHNQEKAFLSRLAESLKAEEIALTVRYFGLGLSRTHERISLPRGRRSA